MLDVLKEKNDVKRYTEFSDIFCACQVGVGERTEIIITTILKGVSANWQ